MNAELPNPYLPNRSELIREHTGASLDNLAGLLTCRYRTSRITCFGWRRREDVPECCPGRSTAGSFNHFFILMETRDLYPEAGIQEYVNCHFMQGRALIIAHHMGKVREMLEAGHRFYSQVRRSGMLLFSDDPEPDPQEFPLPENLIQQAERHFKTHYGMARSFRDGAAAQLAAGQLRIALFLLHQTMEQACIGLIRVFLGYRANFHNIGRLLELCSCFIGSAADRFPGNTAEERRRFQILCRSYTEARYREDFTISADDCRDLLHAVAGFVKQTEDLCQHRLPVLGDLWDNQVLS